MLVGAAEGLKGLDFAVVFAVEASFESLLEIRGQGLLAEGTGGSCGLGVVGVAVAHPVGELLFAASYTVKRERHFRAKVLSGTPALFFKR